MGKEWERFQKNPKEFQLSIPRSSFQRELQNPWHPAAHRGPGADPRGLGVFLCPPMHLHSLTQRALRHSWGHSISQNPAQMPFFRSLGERIESMSLALFPQDKTFTPSSEPCHCINLVLQASRLRSCTVVVESNISEFELSVTCCGVMYRTCCCVHSNDVFHRGF